MRAHVIENGRVANTIEVPDLDFMPGLVDAEQGGQIGDQWDGANFYAPPSAPQADLARHLAAETDARIAAIYNRWMRFEAEYVARESAARAFAAAGYEGDCSMWVSSFATPAGLSPQAAADRIISQANNLRGALEQLGALRMQKYLILQAADAVAAQAAYGAIIAQADAIEAGLQ